MCSAATKNILRIVVSNVEEQVGVLRNIRLVRFSSSGKKIAHFFYFTKIYLVLWMFIFRTSIGIK